MPDRGGSRPSRPRRRVGLPGRGRRRTLLRAAAVLVVLIVLLVFCSGLWTGWLWYRSVGYSSVYSTRLWTRVTLFAVFGLLMTLVVGFNAWLAHRLRSPLSAMSEEQQSLERYRDAVARHRGRTLAAVALIPGLVAGATASSAWQTWLAWINGTSFGTVDPQFHLDVSFYAFDLPWYRFLVDFGFIAVVAALAASALVHYLYGGIRTQGTGRRFSYAAQGHLAVLLGLFVALKAVAYWLDRYALAMKSSSFKAADGWTGLRYVDANAVLPAKTILFCVAAICALLFLVTPLRRTWALPMIGLGLMALSSILIGAVYPAIVQQFEVKPNEKAKEEPYIQRNISATRAAYGIAGTQAADYASNSTPDSAVLAQDSTTLADIRLLDPNVVSPTFEQLQQQRGYYSFPTTLDVDRYPAAGTAGGTQDTVLALRELNLAGVPQNNWINDHFQYTHGYGVVAAQGNAVDPTGKPVFTEYNLPPQGALQPYQPRIYYGEGTTTYSVVGGTNQEIDYSDESAGKDKTYTYQGNSGVSLGDPLTRLAYAVKFGEPQLLYSGAISTGSRILYDRTPQQRVQAVAPWLSIDGDPYPVVVGGHVEWVLDGYTTSDGYPYASRTTLGDATTDSLTSDSRSTVAPANEVNYVRNSVKATVDAYSGAVTLYQWDTKDPVLRTWMKAFPGTVQPYAGISADLKSHLRYPQDLFKVQRELLTRYHVTDPAIFYNGSDVWQIPTDPTSRTGKSQPPYYLSLRMPDQKAAAFSLTTTFVPNQRDNLAAFMAVDSDPGPGYGTIRILKVPTSTNTLGPVQVQAKFNSDPTVAPQISLLQKSGDSTVEYGNLLTLPVGGGLLYVEPVYVRGAGVNYPLLQKVLAVYGNKTVLAPDLPTALASVLGTAPATSPVAAPPTTPPTAGAAPPPANATVAKDLQDAQQAYQDSQAALRKGDFAAYGQAQARLGAALNAAVAAEKAAAKGP
ncbi:UPF0182 family protein [Streptacidiphilus sp. MAP12-16]|uniref:UPF0182 family membrane protein n=1 Tax=Streptacidiphilus sp. MAP12-16 TaxID=3156300 RepID=UPI0035124C96